MEIQDGRIQNEDEPYKKLYYLRKHIAAGLPVIDVNGSKRISKTSIDKLMAEHTVIEGGNHADTK